MRRILAGGLVAAAGALACAPAPHHDLAVTRARIFDVHTASVRGPATILIDGGRIVAVVDGDRVRFTATDTLDAAGRLVTPGIVDVHFHAGELVGDSLDIDPDSIPGLRDRFARAYLPFGVTTVRSCGDNEKWTPLLQRWMQGDASYPDFYACGGALISPDDRNYPGHAEVDGEAQARERVRRYHDAGFRHLKVYWRLREPEFGAVMDEAGLLGMNVTGHVDYRGIGMRRALELGLRWFEHAYTLGVEAVDSTGYDYVNGQVFVDHYAPFIRDGRMPGSFFISRTELFNVLGPEHPEMLRLIGELKAAGAGVTPTLHVFAQRYGLTWHTTPPVRAGYDDVETIGLDHLGRCRDGYRVMAGYVKRMFDAGIPLAVGSDWADPGKACLSEMLLLHECGIPMADVLVAATWNGAVSMGIEADTGAIEPGMKAHLIVFDGDPLADPRHLLGGKTVIKDGRRAR